MAPEKKPKTVDYERTLAWRIRAEREGQNLSLDRVSEKMAQAGCPIDRSSIYKIESGDPPRRITLDEAVAFSRVFGFDLATLVLPAALWRSQEAVRLYKRHELAAKRLGEAYDRVDKLERQMLALADDGYEESIVEALREAGAPDPDGILTTWRFMHVHERLEEDLVAWRDGRAHRGSD